jgi:hypothetical protein
MRHLDILYASSSRSFVEPFAWHTQAHVARGYFGPALKSHYPTVEDPTAAGAHLTNVPPAQDVIIAERYVPWRQHLSANATAFVLQFSIGQHYPRMEQVRPALILGLAALNHSPCYGGDTRASYTRHSLWNG